MMKLRVQFTLECGPEECWEILEVEVADGATEAERDQEIGDMLQDWVNNLAGSSFVILGEAEKTPDA